MNFKKKLEKLLPKSQFSKNVLTVITGSSIAQAIPILSMPILTRIYTPEDFGAFGVYLALCTIISAIITGRYDIAIILPKKDSEAIQLLALSISLSILISLFLFITTHLTYENIIKKNISENFKHLIYLIPISVMITGIYQSLNYWCNRKKKFMVISVSRVSQTSGAVLIQLISSIITRGSLNLVLGQIFGQIIGSIIFIQSEAKNLLYHKKYISIKRVIILAKKYKNFPLHLIFSHLFNSLSSQSAILFINHCFTSVASGFYMLADRLLAVPTSLIAGAIGDVFRQEASKTYAHTGQCKEIFIKTFRKLLILSVAPFLILFFLSEQIFSFVFGEDWRIAGEYAKILTPVFMLRFITTPISQVAIIAGKTKIDLAWQIALLLSTSIALIIGYYSKNLIYFLYSYSTLYSLLFILSLIINYRISAGKEI